MSVSGLHRRRWARSVLAAAALSCCSPPTLAVSCGVSSTGISFGSYTPISAAALDAIGTVTVSCTGLLGLFVSYAISLSPGNSGNQLNRTMSSGGSTALGYNVYTDLTHTMVWGDGTGGTATVSGNFTLVLLGNAASYSAYGHMPAHQIVPAGSYSDAPTLTVTY